MTDRRNGMAKVTVYKFRAYNPKTDEFKLIDRMVTREGARTVPGNIVEDSGIEIDESQLEPATQWTPKGFEPRKG